MTVAMESSFEGEVVVMRVDVLDPVFREMTGGWILVDGNERDSDISTPSDEHSVSPVDHSWTVDVHHTKIWSEPDTKHHDASDEKHPTKKTLWTRMKGTSASGAMTFFFLRVAGGNALLQDLFDLAQTVHNRVGFLSFSPASVQQSSANSFGYCVVDSAMVLAELWKGRKPHLWSARLLHHLAQSWGNWRTSSASNAGQRKLSASFACSVELLNVLLRTNSVAKRVGTGGRTWCLANLSILMSCFVVLKQCREAHECWWPHVKFRALVFFMHELFVGRPRPN